MSLETLESVLETLVSERLFYMREAKRYPELKLWNVVSDRNRRIKLCKEQILRTRFRQNNAMAAE